jgi:alkylation response protein AidB-like acyl-CoA dehydrogenase
VWKSLTDLGVPGLQVEPQYGGFSEGATSLLVVQRELGRGLMSEPVTPSAVIAPAILQAHGSLAQAEEWLEAMAQGRSVMSIAYLEAHSRFDPSAEQASAARIARCQHNSMVWRSNPVCSALGPTKISTSPASNKGCRSGPR